MIDVIKEIILDFQDDELETGVERRVSIRPVTGKREVTALGEAMAELNLVEGTIVTRSEEEQITLESGKINVVPVWRFLLSLKYSES